MFFDAKANMKPEESSESVQTRLPESQAPTSGTPQNPSKPTRGMPNQNGLKRGYKITIDESLKTLIKVFDLAFRHSENYINECHEERLKKMSQVIEDIELAYKCITSETKKARSQIIEDSVKTMRDQAVDGLGSLVNDAKKAQLEQLAKTKKMANKWKKEFDVILAHQANDHRAQVAVLQQQLHNAQGGRPGTSVDSPFFGNSGDRDVDSNNSDGGHTASHIKDWSESVFFAMEDDPPSEEKSDTEPLTPSPPPKRKSKHPPPKPPTYNSSEWLGRRTGTKASTLAAGQQVSSSHADDNALANKRMVQLASFLKGTVKQEEEEGRNLLKLNGTKLSDEKFVDMRKSLQDLQMKYGHLERQNTHLRSHIESLSRAPNHVKLATSGPMTLDEAVDEKVGELKDQIAATEKSVDELPDSARTSSDRSAQLDNETIKTPKTGVVQLRPLAQEISSAEFRGSPSPKTARTWEHAPSAWSAGFPRRTSRHLPGMESIEEVSNRGSDDTEDAAQAYGTRRSSTTPPRLLRRIDRVPRYDIPDHRWLTRDIAHRLMLNLIISAIEPWWHLAIWIVAVFSEIRQGFRLIGFYLGRPVDLSDSPRPPGIPLLPARSVTKLIAHCLMFTTLQVYISASRERQIWLQANALTRQHMLSSYRSPRSWMGIPGVDGDLIWGFGDALSLLRWGGGLIISALMAAWGFVRDSALGLYGESMKLGVLISDVVRGILDRGVTEEGMSS